MAAKPCVVTLMTVRNMNRAIKYYTKSLGARLVYRGRGEMRDFWASVKLLGHDVWLIRPAKWEKRTLAYTTLMVPNIKPFVSRLMRRGVKFQKAEAMSPDARIDGPIAFESYGASAFFKDSEGNLIMVWQNFPGM